jgi:hypothetical protein
MVMRHPRMFPGLSRSDKPVAITAVAIEKVTQLTNESEKSK